MTQIERRYLTAHEVRAATDGRTISGRIPYNSRSSDLGGFVEVVAPGAFDNALAPNADVRFLYNHDVALVLGRTASGTLSLSGDASGLSFRCQLPDTTVAHDVAELVRRQDVSSVSFGFQKIDDAWTRDADGQRVRTLRKVKLLEISPVAFPAFPDTTAVLRSCPFDEQSSEFLSESERHKLQIGLALRIRQ